MHTPTKAQFQTVIDNLNRVVTQYGAYSHDEFDMGQGLASNGSGEICGTVHCIGGWYAIATLQPFSSKTEYSHGASRMARDLGFEHYQDLREWAHVNPVMWGNRYGYEMFFAERAYNDANTLPEAIAHLIGVRDRLPE